MPATNLREDAGGPMDWFNGLPKLSKLYAASLVISGACLSYKIPAVFYMFLDWRAATYKLQAWYLDPEISRSDTAVQVWRMFTHIFISDKLGFHLLMQAIWVLSYGSTLESSTYSIHPEDYLFLFFFGTVLTTVISFILGPLLQIGYVTYTGSAMVMMLLYVWSKEFPHQGIDPGPSEGLLVHEDIKLYGIVKIKGFWLPFAFLVLGMFIGGDVMSDILGIAVGHAWYFFTTLLPRGTGKQYLPTPWYIRWAAAKLELGPQRPAVSVAPPPRQRPPGAPPAGGAQGQGGFRAFGGAARRLGSS